MLGTRGRMKTTFLVKPAIAAFALAAYFVLFLNGAFWKRLFEAVAPAGNPTSTYDWLFLAAIGVGLFLLCAMFFGLFTLPYVFKPAVITLLFASAAAAYFMREYGIVIDSSMVTNTLQTDRAEAGDDGGEGERAEVRLHWLNPRPFKASAGRTSP